MQASPKSIGKVTQCRRIASMDTPDPYTLIVNFKDPYPTFYVDLSMGNSGVCQGIVSKKYVETVGEETAKDKPIGTGPYRLVDGQSGSYFKFEALDSHWRVVPEFKIITVRLLTETSTYIAALKTKEIDLSEVAASQVMDLKAAGLGVEVNPVGGSILMVSLGGLIIPEDKRYDAAYHNKDPWVDSRVRKAMALAIDRAGIAKALYAGFAEPAGVPMLTMGIEKYQYPYDPAAAKQLLKDAGYPNGFSFNCISSVNPLAAETPRVMEALAGYWEQIGLKPKIVVIDYATYYNKNVVTTKTAGAVNILPVNSVADQLAKAELFLFPNVASPIFQDEGSNAIYNAMPKNANFEERLAVLNKLNQYYYDTVGPIPVLRTARCFAWNSDKILPWPHVEAAQPLYLEYVRYAKPHNTFRLFNPWPDR
jgi:peptide/nickel transport system substrate-binding protein